MIKGVTCIVQARMGSTRLPGKVLKTLSDIPMLVHVIRRLKASKLINNIVIATTSSIEDNDIIDIALQENVLYFRGDINDVLGRYVGAAMLTDGDVIVRVTSDCPLISPEVIDDAVKYFIHNDFDYVSPSTELGLIRGLDTEVFSKKALLKANLLADEPEFREHVTLFMYRNPDKFKLGNSPIPEGLNQPGWRLCVDEMDDFKLINEIYKRLYDGNIINIFDVVKLLEKESSLILINKSIMQKKQ